jgi:hypothetical protein
VVGWRKGFRHTATQMAVRKDGGQVFFDIEDVA